jgi:hypothetical protein
VGKSKEVCEAFFFETACPERETKGLVPASA